MAPLTAVFGVPNLVMSIVAVAVCRLPDIDHDYAWLAHRGPTHTIGIAALVVAGGYAWLSVVSVDLPALLLALLLGVTVFLGLLSHLFADGLMVGRDTHAIRPFHPLSPHPFRLGLVRTDSQLANALIQRFPDKFPIAIRRLQEFEKGSRYHFCPAEGSSFVLVLGH
jgi:inner membrane protein